MQIFPFFPPDLVILLFSEIVIFMIINIHEKITQL